MAALALERLASYFSNAECCTVRNQVYGTNKEFSSRGGSSLSDSPNWVTSPAYPSMDCFKTIADLFIKDDEIANRMDKNSFFMLIAKGKSPRARLLQTCLSGSHESCCSVWSQLSIADQHDFLSVYEYGLPTHDFFFNMIMQPDFCKAVHDGSDGGSSGSSSAGSSSSWM